MEYKDISIGSLKSMLSAVGVSYIGACNHSAKLAHGTKIEEMTYGIYLASSDLSGYNVCPNDEHCKEHCLVGSGQARLDTKNTIMGARIKKTKLFYENRAVFMELVSREIKRYEKQAKKKGMRFSVRLNCTSDLSLVLFCMEGKNILELFPHIQFYDYTKVINKTRIGLLEQYPNYDLTLSYDGYNIDKIREYPNLRVAFVYADDTPKKFDGREVIDGDEYDMRYYNPKDCAIGLKAKITKNMIKNHKVNVPSTKFITRNGCELYGE